MKIHVLKTNPQQYSSNSYLITGDWNRIEDVNTLVDAGIDGYILNQLDGISTGVGKRAIEQVLLTHNHFDHAAGVKAVTERFNPRIWSFSDLKMGDRRLIDGQLLRAGDDYLEAVFSPYHSTDSVCFLNSKVGCLFSGDVPINIQTSEGAYADGFRLFLQRMLRLNIKVIYPGHGPVIVENIHNTLRNSLKNVEKAQKL